MLKSRLIPVLLIHRGGLYKSINFQDHKYIGDPLNAVKIFNEMYVDELVILDIDATKLEKPPNYKLIKNLAKECRMPICYGGGINNTQQVERIIQLGVEKVAISNALINNPRLICEAKDKVGSQSLVAVLDIKRHGLLKKKYHIYKKNGSIKTNLDILEFSKKLESYGIGEIILNSIDNDGKQIGYDFEMSDSIIPHLNIPITLLGGAGNFSHLNQANKKYGIIGLGGGSIFVFKGKYRAVLIQYPNEEEKDLILTN